MPSPHFNVKVISRSKGQSAIASAAYRSGDSLYDEREQKTFDYTRKQDILYKEILTPDGAPDWATDRQSLWNQVEAGEKRKDAQLARSITFALPRELDTGQHIQLVRDLVRENFTAKGMIADCAFHEADASDGGKNPHVHILLTMREIDTDGFGKKNREWNDTEVLESWREEFEKRTNDYLEEAGSEGRLSLKSYEDQGSSKTPSVHMGESAWYMEERGLETDRGNENRQIAQRNAIQETVLNQTPRPRPAEKEKPEEIRDAIATPATKTEAGRLEAPLSPSTKTIQGSGGNPTLNASQHSEPAREAQQSALRGYVQNAMFKTALAGAEMVNRLQRFAKLVASKTASLGRDSRSGSQRLRDRYMQRNWTEREQERQRESDDKGHER